MNVIKYRLIISFFLPIILLLGSCENKKAEKLKLIESGDKYVDEGKDSMACPYYEKAYLLDEKDAYINMKLGDCRLMNNQMEEAMAFYNASLDTKPTKEAFRQRATCYLALGNYTNALKDIQNSFDIYPKSAYTISVFGFIYFQMGDYDKSISKLKQAIVLNRDTEVPEKERTDSNILYRDIASCYLNLQQYDSALHYCDVAVAIDSQDYTIYKFRTIIYEKSGNIKSAIKDLKRIIILQPSYPSSYIELAKLYTILNEDNEACNAVKSAKVNGVKLPDDLIHQYCSN